MAKETSKYRKEALALVSEGLSYRAAEAALQREYGRIVADYTTIYYWHRAAKSAKSEQASAA